MNNKMNARRVAFQTLGCKLNQYESDSLATQFQQAGYTIVPFESPAEAYIVNTCTVTGKADRKSRHTIYQAHTRAEGAPADNALVVITGCFARQYSRETPPRANTYVVGNERKNTIVQIVDAHMRGEILDESLLTANPFDYRPAAPIFHTRSMVKIQDGCDNFCSFCIIPLVRGRATSRPLAQVLDDVHSNLAMGYKEIVITGVNISRYCHNGAGFSTLLERILDIEGDFRVRISSLEPDSLDDRFFDLLQHPRMTPHLHLCLQSGSDKVLLRMRRQYLVGDYMNIVDRIRMVVPHFNFTTDIIVGFPYESGADFAASCKVVREVGFSHVHVFPYAIRENTRAARMPGHTSGATKKRRGTIMRNLSLNLKEQYRQRLVGTTERVLVERTECQGHHVWQRGYGEHYVPVAIKDDSQYRSNSWKNVVITALQYFDTEPVLLGSPC